MVTKNPFPVLQEPAWVTDLFWASFAEWKAYKAEKRQAYKSMGERACLKRLFKMFSCEEDAIAAIDYSMAQNYQGIFSEPKFHSAEQEKSSTFDPDKKGFSKL